MIRSQRLCLLVPLIASIFPLIAFADLTQTTTLSTSNQSNLNLDAGATSTSGGDIRFSSAGFATAAKLNSLTSLEISLCPGYSKSDIPLATVSANDLFYVHTNGNHYAALR